MEQVISTSRSTIVARLLSRSGDTVVLAMPGSDYQLHLYAPADPGCTPGSRVTGRIAADAARVDVVPAGGRFIEPVIGRPFRLQGTVVGIDRTMNTITVCCPFPVDCRLTTGQCPDRFQCGQMVCCNLKPDTRFEINTST